MTKAPQWAQELTDDEAEFDRRMRLQLNEATAFDVHPDQTWRLEVAQNIHRHNAVVREVRDGTVHFFGDETAVPVGSLLAYWRYVSG